MKILITDSFKNDFTKIFNSDYLLKDFGLYIKNKKHNIINLKFPHSKMKLKYVGIDLRMIIYVGFEEVLIPIFIVKKANKKYGMNLILDSNMENILDKKFKLSLKDIDNNNYKLY